MEKRFYSAKSPLYGVTVYDRITQVPAFEYGAGANMDDVRAVMLAHRLNALDRRGKLDAYLFSSIWGESESL